MYSRPNDHDIVYRYHSEYNPIFPIYNGDQNYVDAFNTFTERNELKQFLKVNRKAKTISKTNAIKCRAVLLPRRLVGIQRRQEVDSSKFKATHYLVEYLESYGVAPRPLMVNAGEKNVVKQFLKEKRKAKSIKKANAIKCRAVLIPRRLVEIQRRMEVDSSKFKATHYLVCICIAVPMIMTSFIDIIRNTRRDNGR